MNNIPRCMSTQHPDNASIPFFASSSILSGEDEIREAYYSFSHLGCDEQMWDAEGKEFDTYVVKKLLTFYPEYFQENVLGEDLRLTFRVPNPAFERSEAKILLESLESIPRSYDTARLFYGRQVAPIFEVILPMTVSARCIDRIYRYYTDYIIGRQKLPLSKDDITIAEWIGEFAPARINVIPLFEDLPSMLKSAEIVAAYLAGKDIKDQRVFLARSDTAMNFGLVSAALANKIALMKLYNLAEKINVRIHPILGMGSAPFRGGLTPETCEQVGCEYPSVVTFTVQSAFKYDHPVEKVRTACNYLKKRPVGIPTEVDEEKALEIIERYSKAYRKRIVELAPQINNMSKYVPARRARKLHIGLFGYARGLDGVTLPRAISFTCSLYSLGLPPELIAFDVLNDSDLDFLMQVYPSFKSKVTKAMCFADLNGPLMTDSLRNALDKSGWSYSINDEHLAIVRRIRTNLERNETTHISELVLRGALMRRFLG